jgi:hypothetical protein
VLLELLTKVTQVATNLTAQNMEQAAAVVRVQLAFHRRQVLHLAVTVAQA